MQIKTDNCYNLKIGTIFYELNIEHRHYIINIFNDDDLMLIEFKYYNKHKQSWVYKIEELWKFNMSIDHELYYLKK